ncbi:hypothetical protein EZV62_024304 [Acer yangbiense]|uniref:Reticulon-like protein n=1 Tax=Acer yangbiense TaxID=1000413 RepID=A0A5C7H455_9ROSI|nr:hypothetical protein EZV62_024304 [Acer yangbiense]
MVDMALYVAAEYGYADLVKEMIKFHDIAMAGTKSRNGYDAFHIAAKKEIWVCDSLNTTTLHTATSLGHIEVVNFLLEKGSSDSVVAIAKNSAKSALHSAARNGHDAACGGNLKQFLVVVASLWVAAVIGSWCNFLTVLYIGFVCAHTLPVLYEKNEDKVDGFLSNILDQFQHHYQKIDTGFLSKIPKGRFKGKKHE